MFKSQFRSFDDTRGVVAGPHESFSELFDMRVHHVFYTDEARLYLNDVQHEFGLRDMRESDSVFDRFCIYDSSFSLPGEGDDSDDGFDDGFTHNTYKCNGDGNIKPDISDIACEYKSGSEYYLSRPPKNLQTFEKIENAGTEISYRCINCRNCDVCKDDHILLP